jgi:hypothetical protein
VLTQGLGVDAGYAGLTGFSGKREKWECRCRCRLGGEEGVLHGQDMG